jgi:hypothetical protein
MYKYIILSAMLIGCSSTQVNPETPKPDNEKEVVAKEEDSTFKNYVYDRLVSVKLKIEELLDDPKLFSKERFSSISDRIKLLDSLAEYKDVLGDKIMLLVAEIKLKFEELKVKYNS